MAFASAAVPGRRGATSGKDERGSYLYADTAIRGFSLTHISGPGCPVFGDVPTPHMLTGAAIIIAAGLFIFWREQKVRRQAAGEAGS